MDLVGINLDRVADRLRALGFSPQQNDALIEALLAAFRSGNGVARLSGFDLGPQHCNVTIELPIEGKTTKLALGYVVRPSAQPPSVVLVVTSLFRYS